MANVHSGWRGTVQRITAITLDTIERETSFDPRTSFAFLGPSIRACCFEVGEEVVEQFAASYGNVARFVDRSHAKPHVDVVRHTIELLIDRGFAARNIIDSGLCTRCDGSIFHSYPPRGKGRRQESGNRRAVTMANLTPRLPRRRTVFRVISITLTVFIVAVLLLFAYVYKESVGKFQLRKLSLPTRVFADFTPLRAGAPLTSDDLLEKLDRLGYRQAPSLNQPGDYVARAKSRSTSTRASSAIRAATIPRSPFASSFPRPASTASSRCARQATSRPRRSSRSC